MRPARIDRLFVTWLAGALTLWSAALVWLWAERFDPSGPAPAGAAGAMLLAVALTASLPGRAARAIQRLLLAMRLQDSRAMALAMTGTTPPRPQDAAALMRLLAVSAAVTAGGGLATTAAALSAGGLEAAAARLLALGATGWGVFRFVVELVGSLPLALGVGLTFQVTVLIRGGSGRDHYGAVFREWLLGAAWGLAAAGAAWWFDADLLGVCLVAAVAMVAAAAWTVQRVRLTIRPRRVMEPLAGEAVRRRRTGVWLGAAGVAAALAVQARLLRDVVEAGPGLRAMWSAGALALLAGFLGRADGRSRPVGGAQSAGCVIGLLCGVVLQGGLVLRGLAGGAEGALCGALALAGQVPLAALGGLLVSRQRRLFAVAGGRARQYLATVTSAAAVGLLAATWAAALGVGGLLALGAAMVGIVAGVVRGISTARRPDRQLQWAVLGAVLICVTGSVSVVAREGLPAVAAGRWLTTVRPGPAADRVGLDWALGRRRWRSRAVAGAEAALLARHPGRWWVVAHAAPDVAVGRTVAAARWSDPDPTAGPWPGEPAPWRGAFLADVARDRSRFDGVLLAGPPADHPEAWRHYAPGVLRRCGARLLAGGVLAVRTQVRPGRVDDLLAVAAGLREAVGDGWAVVAVDRQGVDALLAGPWRASRPAPAAPAAVVSLERLLGPRRAGRSGRLSGRGWLRPGRTSLADLAARLASDVERVR